MVYASVGRPSVRPSVCLSQHGPWQQKPQHSSKVCCCGPADRRYQSIAARRTERRRAAAECGQCCVVNWTQTYYFTHWLSCLARSLLTFIHRDEDAVNEIQPSVDADYYRRAVQFTEDVFVFSGPQKTCTYLRHVTLKLPSVLWHCWLGVRKSISPLKIEWQSVGVVTCLERRADCLHMVQLMPLHPNTPSSLASFKSRLVLPFWYRPGLPRSSRKRSR